MKQALALLINDIHCNKDNIDEFKKNWREALNICNEKEIFDILVGGDMFTSQASQTLPVLLAVKHALDDASKCDINVTLANGNHDRSDKESIEGYCHIFKGLPDVEVVDECKVIGWDGCDKSIMIVPYFPENGSFTERLERSVAKTIETNKFVNSKEDLILYLHEGVKGALGGLELDTELPRELFEGYHAVLCGHYHDRLRIPETNIYYIGASRQHNFGEDPAKGYTIFYDDGTWSYVDNKVNTRYLTYEIDGKDADDFSFEPKEGYKYRLKVNCTEKQAKDFDKQKFMDMGFNKVEVKAEVKKQETVSVSIDEKYDKAGITKEYQNFCNEKDIDATLGVEYLNKID